MRSNQKTVVFRADASAQIGGGHVVRCLALAHVLHAYGWRCVFVGIKDVVQTVPQILSAPVTFIELFCPQDDTPEKLREHWPEGISCLVVDHYARDHRYESAWRPWAKIILAIDDLANRQHDCDLLLDQTYGRQSADYLPLVPPHCQLLLGADYALLREPFARLREQALQRRRVTSRIQRVLISFGAADTGDITALVLDAFLRLDPTTLVDVVVGSVNQRNNQLEKIFAAHPDRVQVHPGVGAEQMCQLMLNADLAIGACGMSSWERCALGLPTLALITADNQKFIAEQLVKRGAVVMVDDLSGNFSQRLADEYARLKNDNARLKQRSEASAAVCDGLGASRVAENIEQLVLRRYRAKRSLAHLAG